MWLNFDQGNSIRLYFVVTTVNVMRSSSKSGEKFPSLKRTCSSKCCWVGTRAVPCLGVEPYVAGASFREGVVARFTERFPQGFSLSKGRILLLLSKYGPRTSSSVKVVFLLNAKKLTEKNPWGNFGTVLFGFWRG